MTVTSKAGTSKVGTSKVGTDGASVTRDDIETKLRQIRGEVDEVGNRSRSYVLVAGAVAAVAVIGVAYALGRRKGRKRTTVVEVRRI